jgi:hypothetical protein
MSAHSAESASVMPIVSLVPTRRAGLPRSAQFRIGESDAVTVQTLAHATDQGAHELCTHVDDRSCHGIAHEGAEGAFAEVQTRWRE